MSNAIDKPQHQTQDVNKHLLISKPFSAAHPKHIHEHIFAVTHTPVAVWGTGAHLTSPTVGGAREVGCSRCRGGSSQRWRCPQGAASGCAKPPRTLLPSHFSQPQMDSRLLCCFSSQCLFSKVSWLLFNPSNDCLGQVLALLTCS